jgi:hypothetical protein
MSKRLGIITGGVGVSDRADVSEIIVSLLMTP